MGDAVAPKMLKTTHMPHVWIGTRVPAWAPAGGEAGGVGEAAQAKASAEPPGAVVSFSNESHDSSASAEPPGEASCVGDEAAVSYTHLRAHET